MTSRAALLLFRLSSLFTLLAVALGSVVCATRSGFDCHAWPGCYDDRFAPGSSDIPAVLMANPALEMVHRVTAMSTGGVLILAALVSLRLVRPGWIVRWLPWVAVTAAGVSALFGRASVLGLGVDAWGAAADLLAALVAMTASLVTAVAYAHGGRALVRTPVSAPAAAASGLLVVMHLAGHLAAGNRSFTRCLSWPILWLAHGDDLAIQVFRTVLAVAALATVVWTVHVALADSASRKLGLVIAALQVAVVALAVVYRSTNADGGVLGVTFSLASVALLWTLALVAARAAVAGPPAAARPASGAA